MNLKKGDNVSIISGKDRGKTGKIVSALPLLGRVIVEGINIKKKHVRPKRQGQKGQVVQIPASLSASNVMVICPNCSKKTRVGFKFKEQEGVKKSRTKMRICKKCQKEI